jgi:hypothetical protein
VRSGEVAALIALCAAAANADIAPPTDTAPPRPLAIVSFELTPGKPMQLADPKYPAEVIAATRTKYGPILAVIRNVGTSKIDSVAQLTDEEMRTIERLVVAQNLGGWLGKPTGNEAFDYPTKCFFFTSVDGTVKKREQWSQPVVDEERPMALARLLARLAHDKVKSPALHYLVP